MQIKILMRYRSIRTAKIKNSDNTNASKDAVKLNIFYVSGMNIKWYSTLENSFFFKKKLIIQSLYNPAILFLDTYPTKNEKLCLPKNLYLNDHSSFICNSPKLATTKIFFIS